jgi:ribulose 1,5-bisphosphate synthetase/thiazole synthase
MDWIVEPERRTQVIAETDLLVCGGGVAGVAAAVCAARNGAKTLLVERYGFLGGLVTGALVITTPPLNNGINIEIAKRRKNRGVYERCRYPGEEIAEQNLHAVDPEIVKYELARMLQEEGVGLLLHTYIVGSIVEDGVLKGIVVENKAGRQAILATLVIDATGDADVAAFAKAPFRTVKKPMTMMFNMVGVNSEKALGELNVWSGNLLDMDALDPKQLTDAELITREHAMKLAAFLKERLQGFENSRIEYTATQVGVRATRQIFGEACPSMEEVKNERFEDTVVRPYAEVEMRLPYRSLLPQKLENLLVAGRCISAEEEAMGQLRLIPVCSATGQAAGTAAALALRQDTTPRQIDVPRLQIVLIEQGMDLGL